MKNVKRIIAFIKKIIAFDKELSAIVFLALILCIVGVVCLDVYRCSEEKYTEGVCVRSVCKF